MFVDMPSTCWRRAVADRLESAATALRRHRDNECLKELSVAIGYLKAQARRSVGAFDALAFLEAMTDLFRDGDDTRRLEFDPELIRKAREEARARRTDEPPRSVVRVTMPAPPSTRSGSGSL